MCQVTRWGELRTPRTTPQSDRRLQWVNRGTPGRARGPDAMLKHAHLSGMGLVATAEVKSPLVLGLEPR